MGDLAPLAIAVPMTTAALLVGTSWLIPRRVVDVASLLAASTSAVFCALLLHEASKGRIVYWFGGWEPRHGVAIGVSFAIDQLSAGLGLFCALLFVTAFVFSWRYFVVVGPLFHALMLVFLAGMLGFGYTGDLFNLFVFFELMSVAAYALVAYDIEEEGPLQGALNFAVTNTIGAFFILIGIALLYGRTGALNMAQIGASLAGHSPDGLVIVSFTLIAVGFLVKAAVVPFHFWLADAYSVAPTPVCLLLSAAMSELGLYALARVYWTVFSGVLDPGDPGLQAVLVGVGTLTALLGAAMCFGQRHLKRMLAFATVSHVGLFLIGFGLFDAAGLAGTALFVVADGCVKAALFVSVGVIQHLRENVDELRLHGRGRELKLTGPLFAICALAVASLPPFGPFLGKTLVEAAAKDAGLWWVSIVFLLSSALTGGALLRAAGRVFLGLGPTKDALSSDEPSPDETDPELEYRHDRVPRTMTVPAIALAVAGLGLSLVPGLGQHAERAAAQFVDRSAYAASVLHGATGAPPVHATAASVDALGVGIGIASVLVALALAAAALFQGRLRGRALVSVEGAAGAFLGRLRALHSGLVPDYVAWLTVGTVVLAALFAATLSG
jgi:multicomponent Na+:H+ antiporter subunit D